MFFLVLCLCDLLKKATSFPDPGYFTHGLMDWRFSQILKSSPWPFLFFRVANTHRPLFPVQWARAGDKQSGHRLKDTHPCSDSPCGWFCECTKRFIAGWSCNMYKLIAGSHSPGTNNRHNYGSNLKQSLTASSCATIFEQVRTRMALPTFSSLSPLSLHVKGSEQPCGLPQR